MAVAGQRLQGNHGVHGARFYRQGITFANLEIQGPPDHVPGGSRRTQVAYDAAGEFGYDKDRIFMGGLGGGGLHAALLTVRDTAIPAQFAGRCDPRLPPDFRRLSVRRGRGLRCARFPDRKTQVSITPRSRNAYSAGAAVIAYGEKISHLCRQASNRRRDAGGYVETVVVPGRDHFTASLAAANRTGRGCRRSVSAKTPAVRAKQPLAEEKFPLRG
jgi:acetyl esterase/lipase